MSTEKMGDHLKEQERLYLKFAMQRIFYLQWKMKAIVWKREVKYSLPPIIGVDPGSVLALEPALHGLEITEKNFSAFGSNLL